MSAFIRYWIYQLSVNDIIYSIPPWIQGGMDFGAKIKYGGERNFFGAREGTNLGGGKRFC